MYIKINKIPKSMIPVFPTYFWLQLLCCNNWLMKWHNEFILLWFCLCNVTTYPFVIFISYEGILICRFFKILFCVFKELIYLSWYKNVFQQQRWLVSVCLEFLTCPVLGWRPWWAGEWTSFRALIFEWSGGRKHK